MSKELDEAERRAIEMIRFYQDECRKQCAPYIRILANINSLRPRTYVLNGETLVPFVSADEVNDGKV